MKKYRLKPLWQVIKEGGGIEDIHGWDMILPHIHLKVDDARIEPEELGWFGVLTITEQVSADEWIILPEGEFKGSWFEEIMEEDIY